MLHSLLWDMSGVYGFALHGYYYLQWIPFPMLLLLRHVPPVVEHLLALKTMCDLQRALAQRLVTTTLKG